MNTHPVTSIRRQYMEFSPRCLTAIPFTHILSTVKEWQNAFGSPTLCTRFNVTEEAADIHLLDSTYLVSKYKSYPIEILVEILKHHKMSSIEININMDGMIVGVGSDLEHAVEIVEAAYTIRTSKGC